MREVDPAVSGLCEVGPAVTGLCEVDPTVSGLCEGVPRRRDWREARAADQMAGRRRARV